jgi:predicted enzyme related to lactoylglutathione lyase
MPSAPASGTLAWVGLAAADAATAVEFYSAAFGWDADPEADHTRLRRGGTNVALVYSQTAEARTANVTSHWSPFFLVADAGGALERAVESGGVALRDPFDVTGGRVAPLQDLAGAIFSVWAPRPPVGAEPALSDTWWIELSTPDIEAAQAFYALLLGWRYDDSPDAVGVRGPQGRIGAMRRLDGRPAWSPCLRVADVDEARRRVVAAGAGSVGLVEKDALGRRVSIVDPQGAALTLVELGS